MRVPLVQITQNSSLTLWGAEGGALREVVLLLLSPVLL